MFFTGRMPFLPDNQQCQSTEGIFPILSKKFQFFSSSKNLEPTKRTFAISREMLNHYIGHVLAVSIAVSEDSMDCVEVELVHHHRPILCSDRLHATNMHHLHSLRKDPGIFSRNVSKQHPILITSGRNIS